VLGGVCAERRIGTFVEARCVPKPDGGGRDADRGSDGTALDGG